MNKSLSLKEIIKKEFNIVMPISGGDGSSIAEAIKIDKSYSDWSNVEYTLLKLINQLLGRKWKLAKQSTIQKNGKFFDQMKLKVTGDKKNYCNYYFDITDHY